MPETTADEMAAETLKSWGDVLYIERHKRRLKQADVAEMASIDQKTVSNVESGRGTLASFMAIARALDVNLVGGAS